MYQINNFSILEHSYKLCVKELKPSTTVWAKYGYIRKLADELLHKREVLCAIVFGRNVYLQKCNINIAQVIIISLVRVADEQFTLRVVVL